MLHVFQVDGIFVFHHPILLSSLGKALVKFHGTFFTPYIYNGPMPKQERAQFNPSQMAQQCTLG